MIKGVDFPFKWLARVAAFIRIAKSSSETQNFGNGVAQVNTRRIGILAYGSLIDYPGVEIDAFIRERIDGVETPFPVEFARTSRTRGGAPTLVPVDDGGTRVRGVILVLESNLKISQAKDLLWRRETGNVGTDKKYNPPSNPGPNRVIVEEIRNLAGVDTVLYTKIGANIKIRTADHLADLAICSARGSAGDEKKDGIHYLLNALNQGTRTALSSEYEKAILEKTEAKSLAEAYQKIRFGDA